MMSRIVSGSSIPELLGHMKKGDSKKLIKPSYGSVLNLSKDHKDRDLVKLLRSGCLIIEFKKVSAGRFDVRRWNLFYNCATKDRSYLKLAPFETIEDEENNHLLVPVVGKARTNPKYRILNSDILGMYYKEVISKENYCWNLRDFWKETENFIDIIEKIDSDEFEELRSGLREIVTCMETYAPEQMI